MTVKFQINRRVFNRGDMANVEHFGTITKIRDDRWGVQYQIMPDADSDRMEAYWIPQIIISDVDLGHGGTRIVTEDAHNKYREEQIASFRDRYAATS